LRKVIKEKIIMKSIKKKNKASKHIYERDYASILKEEIN